MLRLTASIFAACGLLAGAAAAEASPASDAKGQIGFQYDTAQHNKLQRHYADKWNANVSCAYARRNRLQLIHSSDNESSFQDPNTLETKLLGYSSLVRGLQIMAREECVPSLHVTAGDHTIPGPFYQASTEVRRLGKRGIGDIVMYNAMRLDGNGIGNHEFDGGIDEFAFMLERARYPFISVNLDFSDITLEEGTPEIGVGRDAAKCSRSAGKVVKSCWVRVGKSKVGLIGRAPADFFNVIEDPENTLGGLDFVGGRDPQTNQPLVSAVGQVLEQVKKLEFRGVNRIILLDHAQDFTGDPLQAAKLRGIDIIASAGSTGFFADTQPTGPFNFLRPEDVRTDEDPTYPVIQRDSEGKPVLVINTEQLYRYVGHLMVTFNRKGVISSYDLNRSGPIATSPEGVELLSDEVGRWLRPHRRVSRVFAALQETPTIQDSFAEVGTTATALNGARVDVRTRETNLGRLAADSTLWYVRDVLGETVDVALKNGGGIRETITGPSIIRLTIKAALAFDNTLTVLRLSGDQLLAAMENSVSRYPAADGRFPQIAGMTMEYDPSQPGIQGQASVTTPSRVRNLVVTRTNGSTVALVVNGVAQNLNETFVLATNSFTATGGDGYAAFPAGTEVAVTQIGEQRILEEYIVDSLGGSVNLPDPSTTPRVVQVTNTNN